MRFLRILIFKIKKTPLWENLIIIFIDKKQSIKINITTQLFSNHFFHNMITCCRRYFMTNSIKTPCVAFAACFFFGFLLCAVTINAKTSAKKDINQLIDTIKNSGYIFIRNGTEYSSSQAAAHIRKKYEYYEKEIKTVQDFIDKCASSSSITGRPYIVKKPDGTTENVREWLMRIFKQKKLSGTDAFTTLIALAEDDSEVRMRILKILLLDDFNRESLINSFIHEMKIKSAPSEIIAAFACLSDKNIAAKALEILK